MSQFKIRRSQLAAIAVILLLSSAAFSACQSKQAVSAAIVEPAAIAATESPMPAIVYTVAAPIELPVFELISSEDLAATESAQAPTAPPAATVPPADSTAAIALASPTTLPTATATPQPTFTPPALPLTSSDEHYWLRRPIADGGTVWTDKAYPYGHTLGGRLRPHHGVEFYVPTGTEVLAAASGTIVAAGDDSADIFGPSTDFYGNLIVIELDSRIQGKPVYNLYGHLSEVWATVGQHVEAKQVIALSGNSGVADGPHLHFEVRVGQNQYESTRNPLLWLYPFPGRGTVAGRIVRSDGSLVYEAPVRLNRVDARSQYLATTSYANGSINGDDGWQENFALDDVEAGYYEVIVSTARGKVKSEVWVFPYQTSFVEIVIDR